MKKNTLQRLMGYVLALSVVLGCAGLLLPVGANAESAEVSALALNELGLMGGVGTNSDGSVNFDLGSGANRQTAVTMLVRLIGKESEALAGSWTLPFTDFDDWAKPYIGYAYKNGLVNGTSSTTFGGTNSITAQQYITMLLRALDYDDAAGDFSYSGACAFAKDIGLTDGSYTNSTTSFKRGDVAVISLNALRLKMNGGSKTLYAATSGNADSKVSTAVKNASASAGSTGSSGNTGNTAASANVSRNSDGSISIDYSQTANGIVRVSAKVSGSPKLCIIVTAPSGVQYKYFNTSSTGVTQDFVLSEGNGTYKCTVYKNISGNSYTNLHSVSFDVKLNYSTSPFRRANYYVDYTSSSKCVTAAQTLCKDCKSELDKVRAVYYYVVNNFSYDYDKAATVESGYRPALDTVWNAKKGICFDYAATMAAMLRAEGVATKLVVGYAGTSYHAWINVYTAETGWIEPVVYFDGSDWALMDPTFASTGKDSEAILDFIGNPANYSAKYVY